MSLTSLSEALQLLSTFKEYIIDQDIPEAIESRSNYLAALGLSTYTEILSGFRYGDLRTGREAKVGAGKRYLDFITNYFNNMEYRNVDQRLKNDGLKGLYAVVRSGLTHEYFIKKKSTIVIEKEDSLVNCGIYYDKLSDPQIVFYVRRYFSDFKYGYEAYHTELKNDNSGTLLHHFDSALRSVNSSLIGMLGNQGLVSGTSGSSNNVIVRSRIDNNIN